MSLQCDNGALSGLLAFDSTGQLRDFKRYRLDGNRVAQLNNERPPPFRIGL
jgi:hypothetical protein